MRGHCRIRGLGDMRRACYEALAKRGIGRDLTMTGKKLKSTVN